MSAANTLMALTIVESLLARAEAVNGTILTARKEGRDVSDEELDRATAGDDAARVALEAAIAKAKAEGR